MGRVLNPFDRFPGEIFGLAVVVVVLTLLFAGPWPTLGTITAVCLVQGLLVRRAYIKRDDAVFKHDLMEEREALLRAEIAQLRGRVPFEESDTGVGTLKHLEAGFTRALARFRRWGESFSVAIVEVTDSAHPDRVLDRWVSFGIVRTLLEAARADDVTCRLDNHTFAVLLAGTGETGADAFVDRVRGVLGDACFDTGNGEIRLSVLTGTSEWFKSMSSMVELLSAANSELEAGRAARDRKRAGAA